MAQALRPGKLELSLAEMGRTVGGMAPEGWEEGWFA